jgi:TonB family protein
MRRASLIALFVLLAACASRGQQTTAPASALPEQGQPDQVKVVPIVYIPGPGDTAPELLPPDPAPVSNGKCRKKVEGETFLSVLVDATGKPEKITVTQSAGTELDQLAIQTIAADRFKPGSHGGVPVGVWQTVRVDLKACVEKAWGDEGEEIARLRLRSQPAQKFGVPPQSYGDVFRPGEIVISNNPGDDAAGLYRVGSGVSAPTAISSPAPHFSDEAKRAKYQGICILSLIVDAQGMPQDVRVLRTLGMGLDEKAIEAVKQYRFKPAMKKDEPVPVRIVVEVNFRLY